MSDGRVWLISGCSTGLGRALAQAVLAAGDRAVVTARREAAVADLAAAAPDRALALALDVTRADQIAAAVAAAQARFGRIDVLVNNAGYGYQATAEEGDERAIRAQFETNVFGLFALTRAVLPVMRAQASGTIVNVTSLAGLVGLAGSGYYAASKHAVEGWSDSLRAEVAPLGIGVTCVEPGGFRTDWAGRSLHQTRSAIDDYAATAGQRLAATRDGSGAQPGDPARAADAIVALAHHPAPPRHLVLGAAAHDMARATLQRRLDEITRWRDAAVASDFPAD